MTDAAALYLEKKSISFDLMFSNRFTEKFQLRYHNQWSQSEAEKCGIIMCTVYMRFKFKFVAIIRSKM